MESISSTVWQRKGSSIIFDQDVLGKFISQGAVISLRIALGWMNKIPAHPPVTGKTIVISGLETIVETLPPEDAEEFLNAPESNENINTLYIDHDLGEGKTGYYVITELIEVRKNKPYYVYIVSSNPVGIQNIERCLLHNGYKKRMHRIYERIN